LCFDFRKQKNDSFCFFVVSQHKTDGGGDKTMTKKYKVESLRILANEAQVKT